MTETAIHAELVPLAARTRIRRRRVYELVAEQLTVRVAELRPGDRLPPERELTEAYGVGRSSVREALRVLESRGLITSRGSGRFFVAEWQNPLNESLGFLLASDEGDIGQLFEVRQIVEGEAAALAAARRTDEHLAQLHAAVDEMAAGLDSEERYITADLHFHLLVAEATGNRLVLHLMHAIRDQLRAAFGTVFHIAGSPERSAAQHREIAAAIMSMQPGESRRLMLEHVGRVEREFLEIAASRRPAA